MGVGATGHLPPQRTFTMTALDYPECYDCYRPAEKKCRKCGVLLCDQCYHSKNGLCESCYEDELDVEWEYDDYSYR